MLSRHERRPGFGQGFGLHKCPMITMIMEPFRIHRGSGGALFR